MGAIRRLCTSQKMLSARPSIRSDDKVTLMSNLVESRRLLTFAVESSMQRTIQSDGQTEIRAVESADSNSIPSKQLPSKQLLGPPKKQGLYDPDFEHDACGVGFVVDIK